MTRRLMILASLLAFAACSDTPTETASDEEATTGDDTVSAETETPRDDAEPAEAATADMSRAPETATAEPERDPDLYCDELTGILGAASEGETEALHDSGPHGRLPRSVIHQRIHDHQPEVIACYQEGLRADSSIAGPVHLLFRIAGDGSVMGACIGEGLHPVVDRCVRDAALTWTFPEPDGGSVLVEYPFNLSFRRTSH